MILKAAGKRSFKLRASWIATLEGRVERVERSSGARVDEGVPAAQGARGDPR